MAGKKVIQDSGHSRLSASGSSRWINCTPSIVLEEQYGVAKSSDYAREGTLAHELGETNLKYMTGRMDDSEYVERINNIEASDLYGADMPDEVDKYVSYVLEVFTEERVKTPDALLNIEDRVRLLEQIEDQEGTLDASVVGAGIIHIIDLKYGKGVRVDAIDNSQLKLYAYGALQKYDILYGIDKVVLHIVQPRLDHYSRFELSATDLVTWVNDVALPAAKKAELGEGEAKAGSWCKFCKVEGCRTRAEKHLELAKFDFAMPPVLSMEEVADILKRSQDFTNWLNKLSEFALASAKNGVDVPGFKLVSGRSVRRWTDAEKVAEALVEVGCRADEIYDSKLKGIGAIEKLLGKAGFVKHLGALVYKPEGAPTLVPVEDKRQVLNTAVSDFE